MYRLNRFYVGGSFPKAGNPGNGLGNSIANAGITTGLNLLLPGAGTIASGLAGGDIIGGINSLMNPNAGEAFQDQHVAAEQRAYQRNMQLQGMQGQQRVQYQGYAQGGRLPSYQNGGDVQPGGLRPEQRQRLGQAITDTERQRDWDTGLRDTLGGNVVDTLGTVAKAMVGRDDRSFGDINMKPGSRPAALQGDSPLRLNDPEYAQQAMDLKLRELEQQAIQAGIPQDQMQEAVATSYNQGAGYIQRLAQRHDGSIYSQFRNQVAPYQRDSYADEVNENIPSPARFKGGARIRFR